MVYTMPLEIGEFKGFARVKVVSFLDKVKYLKDTGIELDSNGAMKIPEGIEGFEKLCDVYKKCSQNVEEFNLSDGNGFVISSLEELACTANYQEVMQDISKMVINGPDLGNLKKISKDK